MSLKNIHKSIDIKAPAEKVWQVLLEADYIKNWYTAFGEGIEANTDWQLGSKAVFTDQKGDGMIGRIVTHEPIKKITIEYDGFMSKGQEDLTSENAISAKGSQETYTLEPTNNGTSLDITCDMDESYFEIMFDMWENALQKIKQLAESN